MTTKEVPDLEDLLKDMPSNWGRWGQHDEVGGLNFLDAAQVLRGVSAVHQGRPFTLQLPLATEKGDPVAPGRSTAKRLMVFDRSHYTAGRKRSAPGGLQAADDYICCYLQGSTHYDGLGHAWYGDHMWNGNSAELTVGGMAACGVQPIAERGVVGRGVLLDVARHRGRDVLDPGEHFSHIDLLEIAAAQGVDIEPRDILLLRTGFMGDYYRKPSVDFYEGMVEPGLVYSPELVDWFYEMQIPNLVTDTISNEVGHDPNTGVALTLHAALMRNLGVVFTEMAALDALAQDCAADGQYTFLYVAAPLKVVQGTGGLVNPVVVK